MSDSSFELCFELGYHDQIEGLPCRGPAKLLLDSLKDFVGENLAVKTPNILAMQYLHLPPYGLRHFPHTGGDVNMEDTLLWHRSADKMKITQIITQLFKQIVDSQAEQSQVINLEDFDMVRTNETSPFDSPLTTPDQTDDDLPISAEGMLPIRAEGMGPMTRLAIGDTAIVANLLQAGFDEPFPLVASNERHLVGILTAWMVSHPGEAPPSSATFVPSTLAKKSSHSSELAFATTADHVWVERFKITDLYMGWILKENDGACMMVRSCPGNGGKYRGYKAWIGGDLGFTRKPIADTPGSSRSMSIQYDKPGRGLTKKKSQEAGQSSRDGGLYRSSSYESEQVPSEVTPVLPSLPVAIKEESTSSRVESRQAAIQRKKIERQTDEQRWRFETPPISSLETVKKKRWPPQYVSPPQTPQRRSARLDSTPKRHKSISAIVSPSLQHERSSSPEFVSGSARMPPGPCHSSRVIKRKSHVFKATSPKISLKLKGPNKPNTPLSTAGTTLINEASSVALTTASGVILHFFLSNETLGAVPVPLEQCNSVDVFFTHALNAWTFLGNSDSSHSMAGVRVVMDGIQWPVIVAWGAKDAFGWMINAITKAKTGKVDDLHVQVTCIAK